VSSVVPNGVRIKWPNDILIGRQKVAGILIQNELAGDRVLWSIIGIGLNVNSRAFEADLEATSLALAVGGDLDRFSLLETFCQHFERLWSEWDGGGRAWEERYTELLWSRGRWAAVVLDGNPLMVRPMDVDRQGRLIVELEDGSVASYGLDRLRFAAR
jgi:BirA family biotin operon repressor/biotin-[acetyl-CoA-carboxylase] ligase